MKTKVKNIEKTIEFTEAVGTPTSMMLAARNYKFNVFNKEYQITLPRKGQYKDIDPDQYTEEDGEFNLLQYDNVNKQHLVYFPALSKVLFATRNYPDLNDGQAFTPIVMVVKKDTVEIVGNIIEMVKEN